VLRDGAAIASKKLWSLNSKVPVRAEGNKKTGEPKSKSQTLIPADK
jgi:hypothetical protein